MIFFELFLAFLKIGAFTIGGGYAMIPMIQDAALTNGWMTMQELVEFIAIAESTPGPFAVNIATFIGMQNAGILGAFCATLGVVLPSFVIIFLVARSYAGVADNPYVVGALGGIKPVVVGLISAVILTIAVASIFPNGWQNAEAGAFWGADIKAVGIMGTLFLLQKVRKIHPIGLVALSAGMGILLFGISEIIIP